MSQKLLMETDNGLFLLRKASNQESNWRSDNCYKFIFSVNGVIQYQTNRNQLTIEEQEFILFNPEDDHKQLAIDEQKFLIELKPSFLNEVSRSLFPVQYDTQFATFTQKNPHITNWVNYVLNYAQLEKNDASSMNLFLNHSFTQLALMFLKSAVGTQTKDINLNSYKTISPQLYKTILAMKEDYQHAWMLDEMARISHLGKYQFTHYFKEVVGISPYSWLQIYRVIRSQEMLKHTDQSILNIAMECGFSSVTVYNQLFKRLYGMTPGAFRKMISK